MRPKPESTFDDPHSPHTRRTLGGALAFVAAFLLLLALVLVAASSPVVMLGAAIAIGVARAAVRTVRRRRRTGRAKQLCFPVGGVCVEA